MTPERHLVLPDAPTTVEDSYGHPRFGTYRGELDLVDLTRLRGPYALPAPIRFLKHKRWVYVLITTPDVLVAVAIVHLNYGSNAFLAAWDLRAQKLLHDDFVLGLPGAKAEINGHPGRGLVARFSQPLSDFSLTRTDASDRYRLRISRRKPLRRTPSLELDAELILRAAPPALNVIAPVPNDGVVNVTQKRSNLLVSGTLQVLDRAWPLDGGLGGTDYTHGLLGRRTSWRWAFVQGRLEDGTALGVNLVDGFNDGHPGCNENALWVGNEVLPLPRVRFRFDPDEPGRPWRIDSEDGAVRLEAKPMYVQRRYLDLKVIQSRFVQPLGLFSGELQAFGRTLRLDALPGVTEDQDIRW